MTKKTTTTKARSSAPKTIGRSSRDAIRKEAKSTAFAGPVVTGVAPLVRSGDGVEIVATHPPVHPGAILRDLFLAEYDLTPYHLAKACRMNRSKIERIVREDLGISGDTAVRLGRFFGNSPQFWMNLQATFEVMKAQDEIGEELAAIEPLRHEALSKRGIA